MAVTLIGAAIVALVVSVVVRRRVRRHRQQRPVLTREQLVRRGWMDDLEQR